MIRRRCGIDQDLLADRKLPAVARHERHRRRQVAARAVPNEHDILRMDPELLGMLIDRPRCRVAVLQADGKRVFRRAPVFNRGNGAAGRLGKPPAYLIVGIHALKYPAAAVEKQQQPAAVCLPRRAVQPHTDGGAVNRLDLVIPQVVERGNRRRFEIVKHALNLIDLFQVGRCGIGQQSERRAHTFINCH